MAPQEQAAPAEATSNSSSTSAPEGQEPQANSQPAPASGSQEQQQAAPAEPKGPVTLPDDHPLVVRLAKLKESDATQRQELQELRAKSAQVTKLEEELGKRPTQEAMDTLQTRYDRLEAFLQAAGGPLSKALDSRTFTRRLFETEDKLDDIVRDWHRTNPSTTAQALGSAAAEPAKQNASINDALRAAARK